MDVYVNDIASFLPNEPVNNENMENVLGMLGNASSKIKRIVLKNNKINTRYYAMDPDTGFLTHNNAKLTAEAIRNLSPYEGYSTMDIQCLACGTSTPDLLFPGHALMVCGELGLSGCEAVTASGICISGMIAFKFAWMNVAMGFSQNAVAAGSELASSFIREKFMVPFYKNIHISQLKNDPIRAFDADFLRWMLSDGAGCVFLSNTKSNSGISLKIDWIDHISYSGELETCMYGGGVKQPEGGMFGWRETECIDSAQKAHLFSIRQDIKLLDKHIISTMGRALLKTVQKHGLNGENVTWFLPHYSSNYFRPKFYEEMKRIGFEIPYTKWFTNLPEKGNTGSAAIYIILEELFHSEKLQIGDKVFCFIPESGRFSHCFMMLTVV
jgi:3-oxoacyl-[acyl-carrier-protein] synthase III